MKSKYYIEHLGKRVVPLSLLSLYILAVSCGKPQTNTLRPEATELYHKSVVLMKLYSDSFAMAKDSAALLELQERFTSALTALNFKYPSETCLEISEGENDTLTNLTEKIVELRDSLLYLYAHPSEVSDSIAPDSIADINKTPTKNK